MPEPAETRYAKAADGAHLAYQVVGDGPIDLLELPGTLMSIDAVGDQPIWLRFQERLASFCRLIRIDLRGIGLSDPLDASTPPTVERWMDDALAVLDAAGSERTALWGAGFGGAMALLLAASHPDRVSALILINAFARLVRAPDYEPGVPAALLTNFQESLVDPAQEPLVDDVDLIAPSRAGDPEFRAWWRRTGNRGASPATAGAVYRTLMAVDLRHTLPAIQAPTLVMHRADNNFVRVGQGRWLAAHLPAARYIELPGADHVAWLGDSDAIVDEAEEFLTGVRRAPQATRVLATVLFSDIASSTQRAAAIGDGEWRRVLDGHDDMVRRLLHRFAGREVKATGDGFMATFDGPARAIQCAVAIRDGARQLGLDVRVGLHCGEVELRGADIGGIAVHIAQRVESFADPGEVLVSRTVKDLVAGSTVAFEDRGEHVLKGVPDAWQLFRVSRA
jgi:class 3 adenylate cyclase